jgi:hypothetical protein
MWVLTKTAWFKALGVGFAMSGPVMAWLSADGRASAFDWFAVAWVFLGGVAATLHNPDPAK